MGSFISNIFNKLAASKEARILLLGLDNAGKTSLLYKLTLDENIRTLPTIGFNVESVKYKKLKFVMWDIGGQEKLRRLWQHYYKGTDALIYVVDSADKERIELATEELKIMLQDEDMKNVAVLVFANKQDRSDALKPNEVSDMMDLTSLKNRKWRCQGCSVKEGRGLTEGLDWLAEVLNK